MSKNVLNVNVLDVAKNEYIKRVLTIMVPHITELFKDLYEESKTINKSLKSKEPLIHTFQTQLKNIKDWGENRITDKYTVMLDNNGWSFSDFEDLITAVYVTHVKILTAVTLKDTHEVFKLKVPTLNNFIHAIYIRCAKDIYFSPQLYDDTLKNNKQVKNMSITKQLVKDGILDTIHLLLPMKDLLKFSINMGDEDLLEKDSVQVSDLVNFPDETNKVAFDNNDNNDLGEDDGDEDGIEGGDEGGDEGGVEGDGVDGDDDIKNINIENTKLKKKIL